MFYILIMQSYLAFGLNLIVADERQKNEIESERNFNWKMHKQHKKLEDCKKTLIKEVTWFRDSSDMWHINKSGKSFSNSVDQFCLYDTDSGFV